MNSPEVRECCISFLNRCSRVAPEPAFNCSINRIWLNFITRWIPERWPTSVTNFAILQNIWDVTRCDLTVLTGNFVSEVVSPMHKPWSNTGRKWFDKFLPSLQTSIGPFVKSCRFSLLLDLWHCSKEEVPNLIEHLVSLILEASLQKLFPILRTLRSFAAWSWPPDIVSVFRHDFLFGTSSSGANGKAMPTRHNDYRKQCTYRIGNNMDSAMEMWITVVLHNPIDKILTISIKVFRSAFSFHNPLISFLKSKRNEPTAMIGYGQHGFCKRSLIFSRMLQVEPVLDLKFKRFSRIYQQIC